MNFQHISESVAILTPPRFLEHIQIKSDVIPISWRVKKAERTRVVEL